MDLNGLFQALKDNRVKMPPGGLHIPEAFAQRAQYTPTRPFVPPSPWPSASASASKPATKSGLGPNTTSVSSTMGPSGTTVSMTPVMEDYMRQLTQAIMADPTGKTVATTVADLGQKIAHEALACAGLAPRPAPQPQPQTRGPETVRPTPVRAPPSPRRPTAPQQPSAVTSEPRVSNPPPETREAMTSPTPPQAVIDAAAAAAATETVIPPPPPAARFTRYAEAVRIACGLPGPMPDPSTPTTSFWNYMAELAEHTGVRIYVRVSPLFARCVGTSKRAIIIIDALNNAAEVLQPRGSMDDALTFLHDKDIDVEYTATTLKKYKVNEVQGVAQRYDVATHVADTGKKKVKDVLIQDILDDLAARVRVCEEALV